MTNVAWRQIFSAYLKSNQTEPEQSVDGNKAKPLMS